MAPRGRHFDRRQEDAAQGQEGTGYAVAQGTVTNPVYGYYRLIDETEAAAEEIDLDVDPQATELDDVDDGADSELAIEMEEGDGDQVVYAFYLPVYRRAAEQAGLDRWPMKIGMTTRDLSILTLRGRRPEESGGAEWFLTRPDDLTAIHRFVVSEHDPAADAIPTPSQLSNRLTTS